MWSPERRAILREPIPDTMSASDALPSVIPASLLSAFSLEIVHSRRKPSEAVGRGKIQIGKSKLERRIQID